MCSLICLWLAAVVVIFSCWKTAMLSHWFLCHASLRSPHDTFDVCEHCYCAAYVNHTLLFLRCFPISAQWRFICIGRASPLTRWIVTNATTIQPTSVQSGNSALTDFFLRSLRFLLCDSHQRHWYSFSWKWFQINISNLYNYLVRSPVYIQQKSCCQALAVAFFCNFFAWRKPLGGCPLGVIPLTSQHFITVVFQRAKGEKSSTRVLPLRTPLLPVFGFELGVPTPTFWGIFTRELMLVTKVPQKKYCGLIRLH